MAAHVIWRHGLLFRTSKRYSDVLHTLQISIVRALIFWQLWKGMESATILASEGIKVKNKQTNTKQKQTNNKQTSKQTNFLFFQFMFSSCHQWFVIFFFTSFPMMLLLYLLLGEFVHLSNAVNRISPKCWKSSFQVHFVLFSFTLYFLGANGWAIIAVAKFWACISMLVVSQANWKHFVNFGLPLIIICSLHKK